jgi:hypothetical protein
MQTQKRQIRVNFDCTAVGFAGIPALKKGSVYSIICDMNGIPTNRYWYRRFRDSKIDNCITFLDTQKPKVKIKPKKDVEK